MRIGNSVKRAKSSYIATASVGFLGMFLNLVKGIDAAAILISFALVTLGVVGYFLVGIEYEGRRTKLGYLAVFISENGNLPLYFFLVFSLVYLIKF